jgi:hypothetical protein
VLDGLTEARSALVAMGVERERVAEERLAPQSRLPVPAGVR